jgi:ATP-dependent exoDNAse (exonuclease V) beta subunit
MPGSRNAGSINLQINYRSQNSILRLANSIVNLLEELFPSSIDLMPQEVSQKQGPKPFIIDPISDELLCQYFFG